MKRRWAVLLAILGLLFLLASQWPDQRLHLIVCNVGQGDAILLTQGFSQVLIDGGPDDKVLGCLSRHLPFWDRRVELVLLTHPESDHLTGLVDVLRRYRVRYFGLNNFGKQTPAFRRLARTLNDHKIRTFQPRQGMKIRVGLMYFDVIWPDQIAIKERQVILDNKQKWQGFPVIKDSDFNANDYSLTVRLAFGRFSALLTGDLSRESSLPLIWRRQLPQALVLKVPHHGSRNDNPPELYQTVRPRLAAISVGKNNYGQPAPQLLRFLDGRGIYYWRTDRDGELELVSDGRRWSILSPRPRRWGRVGK